MNVQELKSLYAFCKESEKEKLVESEHQSQENAVKASCQEAIKRDNIHKALLRWDLKSDPKTQKLVPKSNR